MATSVFSKSKLFTKYDVELTFRNKVLGGTPKNPKVIEAWIRTRMGLDDNWEVRQMMLQTLEELGVEVSEGMTDEEIMEASDKVSSVKQTNGFKQNSQGLYLEDRQVKASIKECVNILYAGDRWKRKGQTGSGKGPKNFTAERVFIKPAHILLGRMEPDGIELMMIHASGPQGPVNSLAYHEYASEPTISFTVEVCNDDIKSEHWPEIWTLGQEIGLGACRSQSFGRFDVTKWEQA